MTLSQKQQDRKQIEIMKSSPYPIASFPTWTRCSHPSDTRAVKTLHPVRTHVFLHSLLFEDALTQPWEALVGCTMTAVWRRYRSLCSYLPLLLNHDRAQRIFLPASPDIASSLSPSAHPLSQSSLCHWLSHLSSPRHHEGLVFISSFDSKPTNVQVP